MKRALDTLLDSLIQQAELHSTFATHIKNFVIEPINKERIKLSEEKIAWLESISTVNKNKKQLQERLKAEENKLLLINQEISQLKAKQSQGFNIQEQLSTLEGKRDLLNGPLSAFKVTVSSNQTQLHEKIKDILDTIENNETKRIRILKDTLNQYCDLLIKMDKNTNEIHENMKTTFNHINEHKEVQEFIKKHGFSVKDHSSLIELYKSFGIESKCDDKKVEEEEVKVKKKSKEDVKWEGFRDRVQIVEDEFALYPFANTLKIFKVHSDIEGKDLFIPRIYLVILHSFIQWYNIKMKRKTIQVIRVPSELAKGLKVSNEQLIDIKSFMETIAISEKLAATESHYLYFSLLYTLKQIKSYLLKEIKLNEGIEVYFKAIYTMAWGYIFWVIAAKTQYNDQLFANEFKSLIDIPKLSKYMEQPTFNSIDFCKLTIHSLYILHKANNKVGKYSLKPPLIFVYKIFFKSIGMLIIDEDEKNMLNVGYKKIIDIITPLNNALGLSMETLYACVIVYIWDTYLAHYTTFADMNEDQNKALRALESITKTLQSIRKTIKWEEQIELAGILMKVYDKIEDILDDTITMFGKCINKIKYIISLLKLIHGYCWILPNEESYEQRLSRILENNGRKAINSYIAKYKETNGEVVKDLIGLVEKLLAQVTSFSDKYTATYDEFIENSIHHFSKLASSFIIQELNNRLPSVPIEKGAEEFMNLLGLLKVFDLVAKNTTNNVTHKACIQFLEHFLQEK